jgi:hypothetical protein
MAAYTIRSPSLRLFVPSFMLIIQRAKRNEVM